PRVLRTHLPAYACRIYVAAFRARTGLCIYWPAHPAAPPLSASCSSGQRFACGFLRIPSRDGHPCRSANTSPCRVCRGLSPPSECALPGAPKKSPASLRGWFIASRRSYLPVPVRLEVCGLLLALSATLNNPVLVPVAVGVNVTLILQLALAARLVVQVVVETLKSPVVEITMLFSVTLCLLVRVNTFAVLVVPTFCAGYVALAGANVAGGMPVPDSGTVCGLFVALSVIVRFPVRSPSWVGVKVTLITQFFPAASVLPQGFVLVVCAKSPLVAMLLMFSVAVPVLLSVTLFAGVVTPTTVLPNVREVGTRVTTGLPPLAFTVRLSVVVFVNAPDVPVIVTVTVPVAAVALAVKVNVLVEVVGFGANPAVTPLGRPEALKVTLPLKPFTGTTVMVLVPLLPWVMVTVLGKAVRLKFGLPEQPVKMNDPMFVCQLKVPLTSSYWSTYQKVQSSLGSTTMAV